MKLTRSILVFGDFLLAGYCHAIGLLLLFEQAPAEGQMLVTLGGNAAIFAAILVMTGSFLEIYTPEKSLRKRELVVKICGSLLIAYVLLTLLYTIWPAQTTGYSVLALSLVAFGCIQLFWHRHSGRLFNLLGVSQKLVILGVGPLARKIEDLLGTTRHNYVFSGFINPTTEVLAVSPNLIIGNIDQVAETIRREKIKKVVISITERRGVLPVKDILNFKLGGVEVDDAVSFYERMSGKLLLENINPSWFIFSNGFRVTAPMRLSKRILDLLLALIGLILTLPLFPFLAMLIKCDSRGPVFFKQARVGEREKVFMVYKFRTMREDAEKLTGAVWATKDDPRITRIGRFMRKVRLDELPQLWNVLKGDMSFVGPRPERPEFVERLKEKIPFYSKRHFVKPGITGWAQVKYTYGASEEDALEKLRYDLYYVKHLSVFFDLLIVLETIKVVFLTRGAR